MPVATAVTLFVLLSLTHESFGTPSNLLPNGDAENEFVNQMTEADGYATRIQARDTGTPTYWRLTAGASLCKEVKYAGSGSIRLQSGDTEVSATVFSNFWRVKDPSMPFGLPLAPDKEIRVSFYYKTSQSLKDSALTAKIRFGTIADLPSTNDEIALSPSPEWKIVERTLICTELRWGAEITFALAAGVGSVWIDNVRLTQDLGNPQNLVRNSSFERLGPAGEWPTAWLAPIEDQWVSWVGAQYRPPDLDVTTRASGRRSLRASVTYADVSGISQEIYLHQDRPRSVVVTIRSKLDNSIGNRPPGYYGSDNLPNLTVFVHHRDGTMQEVSPTLCLAESDHDWDYRRFGFRPQKTVEKIRIQITVVGTEPTTSLWIDDVTAFELTDGTEEPFSIKNAPPRSLSCSWGNLGRFGEGRIHAANDSDNLYLSIPRRAECRETLIYLNKNVGAEFVNHSRYLYDVIRIREDGSIERGKVTEKQGYIASGLFVDGVGAGLALERTGGTYLLSIPYRALALEGPPEKPIGFNVRWMLPDESIHWTGNTVNTAHLGRLICASPPGLTVRALRFGDRYERETSQSQDLVSHPPIYAGMNRAELCLTNRGEGVQVEISASVRGREPFRGSYRIGADESKTVTFRYDAGVDHLGDFDLSLHVDGRETAATSYPLAVPPAVEIVLDQEFYFPEETTAQVEVHCRMRPTPDDGNVVLRVKDLITGETVLEAAQEIESSTSALSFPIGRLRINELPLQDYSLVVSYFGGDDLLGSREAPFGRIQHTERRPLPPIERLRVDDEGRIIINEDFRFFPIVPSVTIMEWRDAIDLGANVFRGYYHKLPKDGGLVSKSETLEEVDRAWELGAYALTIGPGPGAMEGFAREAGELLSHPGFLACYAKQFYYWNLSEELIEYRKEVERIVGAQPLPRLVIWGHHDSSLLYDWGLPPWSATKPPVGYCYVKIMGRPGSAWRNAPYLTQTEQVLDPSRFKLAEVNFYVSYHDDEIVPEHFTTYLSIRGDDWRGGRNESYLSVIYGANGLYHYICTQEGGIQRLRGWFQELNFMWPVFAADDAEISVSVSPADSEIEVRLKKWNGKYYLLTANASEETCQAIIQLDGLKDMDVRKLFDLGEHTAVTENTITDKWYKYDAFVYEITARD